MRPLRRMDAKVDNEVYCFSKSLPGISCTYTNQTSSFVVNTYGKKKPQWGVSEEIAAEKHRNLATLNPLFEEFVEISFTSDDTAALSTEPSF